MSEDTTEGTIVGEVTDNIMEVNSEEGKVEDTPEDTICDSLDMSPEFILDDDTISSLSYSVDDDIWSSLEEVITVEDVGDEETAAGVRT